MLGSLPDIERRQFNPSFAAMVDAVDKSVGRVVPKIDELNIAENTLIVFTSDNGGVPKVSQLDPLCGEKGSLFEARVRFPARVRWTGEVESATTCDTPISSVDFLPTFAAMSGSLVPTTQPIDGVDIVSLFQAKKSPSEAYAGTTRCI